MSKRTVLSDDAVLRVDLSDGDDVAALMDIATHLNTCIDKATGLARPNPALAASALVTAAAFLLLRDGKSALGSPLTPCEVVAHLVTMGYHASLPLHATASCDPHNVKRQK